MPKFESKRGSTSLSFGADTLETTPRWKSLHARRCDVLGESRVVFVLSEMTKNFVGGANRVQGSVFDRLQLVHNFKVNLESACVFWRS